jgi:integrase
VERFLSTDELARLGSALTAAERGELLIEEVDPAAPPIKKQRGGQKKTGPRSEKPSVVAATRLLLFTGCRVGEILSLRWSHVHLERKLLLLADSKTGAKAMYSSEAAFRC